MKGRDIHLFTLTFQVIDYRNIVSVPTRYYGYIKLVTIRVNQQIEY